MITVSNPCPQGLACILINDVPLMQPLGVDLVVDHSDGLVHVLLPLSTLVRYVFRLSMTVEQIGHLVAELAEAAELVAEIDATPIELNAP